MFIDNVEIDVKAGNGGNGIVSFRREKFVDKGGPNGGDGGHGANVVLVGSNREHTLAGFRYQKLVQGARGEDGSKQNMRGKSADHLRVNVPVGTQAIDVKTGKLLADITEEGQEVIIAEGGKGGFGNAHFKSSTRQAPMVAEKGTPGEEKQVRLELKLIADVALVGLPNAGKSTLLSVISNAKPEIADYPFTTLTPNLGVVDFRDESILFADIPGLIEKAHEGKGLGHEFLRHVERTRALVHLIDIYSEEVVASYKTIRTELEKYSGYLAGLPEVIALSKADGLDVSAINEVAARLQSHVRPETVIIGISAQAHSGIDTLLSEVSNLLVKVTDVAEEESELDDTAVFRLSQDEEDDWVIETDGKVFTVTGRKIEQFALKTYFDDYYSVQRLTDILHKLGILHELSRKGYEPGQDIVFGSPEIGRIAL